MTFFKTAQRVTIGEMTVGQVGYIYASGIMFEAGTANHWLNPSSTIYDSPVLGARIERTEAGYLATVVYGKSPSIWHGATNPIDVGFVPTRYAMAARL